MIPRADGDMIQQLCAALDAKRAEIMRLRAALANIAIGGIGERNFTMSELRAYAEDALK